MSASVDTQMLSLPAVAERLGVPVTKVHQMLRDGVLVAVRPEGGAPVVPVGFLGVDSDGRPAPVKGLPGVITLLRDAHYSDDDIVEWLHRADDTLPGRPIDALQENRGTEIKRRAQAAGF